MKNISYAKNMAAWSQGDHVAPLKEQLVEEQVDIINETLFDDSTKDAVMLATKLVNKLNDMYEMRSLKEVYDAKIHLAMVENILKSLN